MERKVAPSPFSQPKGADQSEQGNYKQIIQIAETEPYAKKFAFFYLVNKTGTTELSFETMSKNLFKPFLVMVVAFSTRIIYSPNIKHRI